MIIFSVITVSLATAGISLVLPEAYRARAVVYPPIEGGDAFGLSSLMSDLPMSFLGIGDGAVSATEFVPILESARVAEAVAEKFKLAERYQPKTREELRMMMSDRLEVQLSREQFLNVSYEDQTPQLAADITNTFIDQLDRALRERSQEKSASFRRFLEERLQTAKADMQTAEQAYNLFQQDNMAIDLDAQAKSQIESANKLITELAMLTLEAEVASHLMSPDNPKVRQLETQITATRDVLDRFLMGKRPNVEGAPGGAPRVRAESETPEIFIPFRDMPDLGLTAVRLKRDVEIQSAIYQFVRQEYEKARFEEEKETVQVVVLDRAVAPDTRSSPRRSLMVILAFSLSLVVSVFIAFLIEGYRRLSGDDRTKLDGILTDLRGRP